MCLVVVLAILLNCFPVKADAVAVTGTLAIGIAACLILMSAGVIFNPQTVEDIEAIGQSFQTHLTDWGASNGKQAEVLDWLQTIVIVNPFGAPDGDDDGEDDWSAQRIRLSRGLLGGISSWIAGILLMNIPIFDPDTAPVGFSYVNIGTFRKGYEYMKDGDYAYFLNDTSEVIQLIHDSYDSRLAIVFCCDSSYLYGFYWTDEGYFATGLWDNPDGVVHASDMGTYPLDSLNLVKSMASAHPGSYIYFSKEVCEGKSDFLTSSYAAIDWDGDFDKFWSSDYSYDFPVFVKRSYNTTWSTSTTNADVFYTNLMPEIVYCPASEDDVLWGEYVPIEPGLIVGNLVEDLESGAITEEEIPLQDLDYSLLFPAGQTATQSLQNVVQQFYGGDMTLEKYLELTQVADTGAEAPSIVVDIPLGSELTYFQGAAPSPITVLASSPDGGTISYEWYRYGTDADGKVYPVEVLDADNSLLPSTSDLGTSYYYCRVINTDTSGLTNFVHTSSIKVSIVADPNAGTDTEPDIGTDINPDSIGQLDSETFWKKLPSAFTQPLESLATSILDGIKEIFVPSQDYLSSKVDALTAEFGFIGPVVTAARSIVLPFNDFEPEPPVIYLHLEDTRGSYDLGGTVPFIDMTWYAEYKPIGDALLSSFLWVVFIWRLFQRLPGLISGMSFDFVFRPLSSLQTSPDNTTVNRHYFEDMNDPLVDFDPHDPGYRFDYDSTKWTSEQWNEFKAYHDLW